MKIALIAANGKIGQHIAGEILARGHELIAITRSDKALPAALAGAEHRIASVLDRAALAQAVAGADVIASAYGPAQGQEAELSEVANSLISTARQSGIQRLIVIGGAGSLEVAPGVQLVDIPEFPAAYKAVASAARESLGLYRQADDLAWTFFAPAAMIMPGEKRGGFKVGRRQLLSDAAGNSLIHYPDFATAFVDEIEQSQFVRDIATVAYA
jgi:putative NADH-flavin reductase